jgi:hypothetical protein
VSYCINDYRWLLWLISHKRSRLINTFTSLTHAVYTFTVCIFNRESDKQCAPIFSSGPLLVYDSQLGDGKEGIPKGMASENTMWTKYYKANLRRPEEVEELAPWVLNRLESYSGLVISNRNRSGQQQLQPEQEQQQQDGGEEVVEQGKPSVPPSSAKSALYAAAKIDAKTAEERRYWRLATGGEGPTGTDGGGSASSNA